MQKIEIKTEFGWATAKFGRYANGHLGIQLFESGMPLARISTNLPDTEIESREFHFDDNNCGSIKDDILKSGYFEDTGKMDKSGWCEYPVYRVKDHVEIVEN